MKLKRVLSLLFATLMLLSSAALSACGSGDPPTTAILSCTRKGDKITVKASLSDEDLAERKGAQLTLLALPSPDAPLSLGAAVKTTKAKTNMTFTYTEETAGALAFVLAEQQGESYIALTDVFCQAASASSAAVTKKPLLVDGLKGLCSPDPFEAAILGADRFLMEISLSELMLGGYETGAVSHIYDNMTYYFDGDTLAELDKLASDAAKAGLRIYLRSYLGSPIVADHDEGQQGSPAALYRKNSTASAAGYLPATNTGAGAGYICAFYDFLSKRYNGKEQALVTDHIIGREVNNYGENCLSDGNSDLLKGYHAWVRLAYNTLSANQKHAAVYLSVDNLWREENTEAGNSRMGTKSFLSSFADLSKSAGDFPWSLALSLGNGSDLSSVLSGNDKNYFTIGAANLSDLTNFMSESALLYGTKKRTVIIDSLSLDPELGEKNRAAYYTYAYYKAAEAGFEALIYDGRTGDLKSSIGKESDFYYAFLMCGSSITSQLSSYTSRLPGAALPKFSDHQSRHLTFEQTVSTSVGDAVLRNRAEFPASLADLSAGGDGYDARLEKGQREGEQSTTLTLSAAPGECYGVLTASELPGDKILKKGYLALTLSANRECKVTVLLADRLSEEGKSAAYLGEVTVTSTPTVYYFNISPFTKEASTADTLTLSICTEPGSSTTALSLHELALYGTSGSGGDTALSVLGVVLATLGVCALLFLLTRRRKKQIRQESEDRAV